MERGCLGKAEAREVALESVVRSIDCSFVRLLKNRDTTIHHHYLLLQAGKQAGKQALPHLIGSVRFVNPTKAKIPSTCLLPIIRRTQKANYLHAINHLQKGEGEGIGLGMGSVVAYMSWS